MDLNPPQARGRDLANLQVPPDSPNEVELYDDLVSFAELSPEEREHQQHQFSDASLAEPVETPVLDASGKEVMNAHSEPAIESGVISTDSQPAAHADEISRSFAILEETEPTHGLTDEAPFTGAMSPGICVNCGAESGSEDLFCAVCAAFVDDVDEVENVLHPAPICAECGLDISSDEVFCPGCGAVLPSS